jgi:ABC-type Zn uptake system ZnuABC Zn-binding protein ZnuA
MNQPDRRPLLPRVRRLLAPILGVAAAVFLISFGGCLTTVDPWKDQPGPPRLLTSFAPLYCFVKNVAGDRAGVLCLLSNRGPHDYDYTQADVIPLARADVFFSNGLGLDEFSAKLVNNSGNRKLKLVELAEEGVEEVDKSRIRYLGHAVKHGDHVHEAGPDPHVWLGIPEAVLMVKCVCKNLKEVDPDGADGYEKRAGDYIKKLEHLEEYGREQFKSKKDRTLIPFHDSLFYFARSFGLEIVDSIESRAGVEADTHRIEELAKLCHDKNVRVITSEPQYPSNTAAQALLDTIRSRGWPGPKVVEVDPLETAKSEDLTADWYERKMRGNIDRLAKELQ